MPGNWICYCAWKQYYNHWAGSVTKTLMFGKWLVKQNKIEYKQNLLGGSIKISFAVIIEQNLVQLSITH